MSKEQFLLEAMRGAYWITVQRQPDGKEIFSGSGPDFVKWGDVEAACKMIEKSDGATYCQYCGAKERKFCKCGPITKNH